MGTQGGQTMPEYLVVTVALVGAFFWSVNSDCPGYDNCLAKLKTVMHNKYQGYSNSLSAVHQYGALKGKGFESEWGNGGGSEDDGGGNDGSGGGGSVPEGPPLSRSNLVISPDGSNVYGTLGTAADGRAVVTDQTGKIIGTYDGSSGIIKLEDGVTANAVMMEQVVDREGNIVPLEAVVDCGTGDVYGFGYHSDGKFFNSTRLAEMNIGGHCRAPTFPIVNTIGQPTSGGVVGDHYFAATLTESLPGTPLTASGEVIYFNTTVPDEDEYQYSDPGPGKPVVDCAIMVKGWSADDSRDPLDLYLNSSPSPRIGSLAPSAGIPCPGQSAG